MSKDTSIKVRMTNELRGQVQAVARKDRRAEAFLVREWIECGLRAREVSRLMEQTTYRALTLQEIVDQLLACEYECDGGPLHLNAAFLELVAMAAAERFRMAQEGGDQ